MHLTDEQLNEYLDHETKDRAQIELHLSTCEDCSARFAALGDLFSKIESLPELEISPAFASRFAQRPSPVTQLPRSITLAMTLQAVLVMITIAVAAPFVMQSLSPYLSNLPAPSPLDLFLPLQIQWTTWLDMLAQIQLPSVQVPSLQISSLMLTLILMGASLLWLIGNGLLLRNQRK